MDKPSPHPLKGELKRRGMVLQNIIFTLQKRKLYSTSLASLSKWLTGYAPMPTDLEEKLRELIAENDFRQGRG